MENGKAKVLRIIKEAMEIDRRTGWGAHLPIGMERKSVLQDMMECWGANNLQELFTIMMKYH